MKIWDASLNAFRDAKLVRRYDTELNAFIDVQGAYISEAGVRRQVWPTKKYLIKDGKVTSIGGGLVAKAEKDAYMGSDYTAVAPALIYLDGSIDMKMPFPSNSYNTGRVYFSKKIDVSGYKKIGVVYSIWRIGGEYSFAFLYGLGGGIGIGGGNYNHSQVYNYSGSGGNISGTGEKTVYFALSTRTASFTACEAQIRISDLWLEP